MTKNRREWIKYNTTSILQLAIKDFERKVFIMANKRRKNLIHDEEIEDTTLYGEFISSFDQWTTMDNQRKRVRHLEEISKNLVGEKINNKGEDK